jgi:hypothetical protein
MIFILTTDLTSSIRAYRLKQILDSDDSILDVAESEAIATVKDALYAHFDIDQIFASTGTQRPMQVVSWIKHLLLYKIYERVPDEAVPDRVVKHYDEAMDMLDKIAGGLRSINLPRKIEEDISGGPKTKFRWGSVKKRSN